MCQVFIERAVGGLPTVQLHIAKETCYIVVGARAGFVVEASARKL